MSFTSDENNQDEKALLGLITEQEKNKKTITEASKEKKEPKGNKKEKINVDFNEDALEGFNTKSKKLMS